MAAGDNSNVAITAGTGTPVDTFLQASGDHRQAVVIGDKTDTNTASVFGAGFLRMSDEPRQIFYDPFDTAPDTVNVWTTNNAGGGAAPAVTTGTLTVGTGTTAAGYSQVTSIPTFKPSVPAWIGYSFALSMTDLAAPIAQSYRFWGAGTSPGSPTVAAPLTDAIGFELATDGKMYAVVYAGGSRTSIQDLSAATGNSKQPTDTAIHRYGVYYRTDRSYFFIDALDNVVATSSFQAPQVQTLPVKLLAIAGNTPSSSGIISATGLAVWDTGKNVTQLGDGTYPWRKAKIDASGNQMTASPDVSGSGTITATDAVLGVHAGAGVLLTGTPTASSYVALALGFGESAFIAQVTGTFGSGTIWFEASADSTTGINGYWTTLSTRTIGTTGSTLQDSTTIAGLYRGNAGGMNYLRVRVTGATTPSIAVVLRASDGDGPVAMNAPIPAGTNNIGVVGPAPSATGTITAPALSLTSFTVLASNTARKTATFYNDSNNLVYLAMAATASTTSYSVQLPSGGYYELPGTNAVFTGLVSGIALTATGNVRVTELT